MIASLVNHKEKFMRSEKNQQAILRIGQAVNVAIERFITVGEAIGDDNPEIKLDMYDACKEARSAGMAIEKLCELQYGETGKDDGADRAALLRASKLLLSSVTRVLLAADAIVVQQLIQSKERVSRTLSKLEAVTNFAEFVKAFSQFGAEMVEFAHLTAERQNDLKDERRRTLMMLARRTLERSIVLLLTSSKMCARHPECTRARENRDTVFIQIRRAMDLIYIVVKEGILSSTSYAKDGSGSPGAISSHFWKLREINSEDSIGYLLQRLQQNLKRASTGVATQGFQDRLVSDTESIIEKTQDFTDSAYTSHEHRENILVLCDRVKLELNHLIRVGLDSPKDYNSPNSSCGANLPASPLVKATSDLRQQLLATALEHASFLLQGSVEDSEILSAVKGAALAGDAVRLKEHCDRLKDHIERIQEICGLLRHVGQTEPLQLAARHTFASLTVYGTQVLLTATALCLRSSSKIAKVNFEAFTEMWRSLVTDVTNIAREIDELNRESSAASKQKYGRTGKLAKSPPHLNQQDQEKIAKAGLEMKVISSEIDAEADKWIDSAVNEDNEIVRRAKNLSSMAVEMYQFTQGEGSVRTTQELFTQAEYFAEEANSLYKVVRQFSYQVPSSPNKKDLLEFLDKVPTHVQQLQFTVKNPTVGKAATFSKVDSVIQETRNLINIISRVLTVCFVCAAKYNLDFRGLGHRTRNSFTYQNENDDIIGFSSESGKAYGGSSSDQSI